ncbi:hypothetical protein JCM19992_30300 [Thermostilla marina]
MARGHIGGRLHVRQHARCVILLIAAAVSVTVGRQVPPVAAGEDTAIESPYREGTSGRGELRFVDRVPLLILRGTPQQIGRQEAALCQNAGKDVLLEYPKQLAELLEIDGGWNAFVEAGRRLLPQIPAHHRRELEALAETADIPFDALVAVNTFPDSYRGMMACSSLMVEPPASKTGGLLFGRNLDFFAHREMSRYTIVKVYASHDDCFALAAVGFPGIVGVLSGMNEKGLALAVHEVRMSADRAPQFNPDGVPYMMAMRRVLETCSTCDEAAKMLERMPRTTPLNIALADRKTACVVEMTPKTVAVRRAEDDICVCTNHFRTDRLAWIVFPWRYAILREAVEAKPLGIDDVIGYLDRVNLRFLTVQSMVFETTPLVLHLAWGKTPATKLPYHRVDLKPWLTSQSSSEEHATGSPQATAVLR